MAKKDQDQANGSEAAQGGESITKTAAVREALEVLGYDARNDDIEAFILQKYGKDAVSSNISVAKSAILKSLGKNPRRRKRRGGRRPKEAQAQQPMTVAAPRTASGGAISLEAAQAVKDLVGELGADTVKGLADLFEGK